MIEVSELTKRYGGKTAVDQLSFTVLHRHPRGLRHVGALLDAGQVHGGRSAAAHLSALALSNGIPRRRVGEVLREVGLAEVANDRIGGFSLGMKQRLGIATALLGDPPVLMFDEPINGMDPEGVLWVRRLFRRPPATFLTWNGPPSQAASPRTELMRSRSDSPDLPPNSTCRPPTSSLSQAGRCRRNSFPRSASLSTLHGMLWRWDPSPHRRQQLSAPAGPLGWTLPDLFAVADEPYSEELRPVLHCHRLGRVFPAAVPLTTAQLIETAEEADRLSMREDHGVWQPVSQGFAEECPDLP